MQEGEGTVVRQGHPIAVVGAFLIALVVVGCGVGGPGNLDGRDGERGAATTKEETTAPEGDRSKAQTAQEPVGLDAKVVSPLGQANLPAGFGEGSLWTTDPSATCDDVEEMSGSASASAGAAGASAGCAGPVKTLLKRVDPRTGEVVATIPLKDLSDVFT